MKGELGFLNHALTHSDKPSVLHHRIILNELLSELKISVENSDKNIYVHHIVGSAAVKLIEHSQATLHNASHFLSNSLQSQ